MKEKRITVQEKVCTGSDLANVLKRARLSEAEAKAWRKDLQRNSKGA